ncbi:unnamed protein product, partial [Prorocentrum cordatum]
TELSDAQSLLTFVGQNRLGMDIERGQELMQVVTGTMMTLLSKVTVLGGHVESQEVAWKLLSTAALDKIGETVPPTWGKVLKSCQKIKSEGVGEYVNGGSPHKALIEGGFTVQQMTAYKAGLLLSVASQLGNMEVNIVPRGTVPYVPHVIKLHIDELKEKHSLQHVLHDEAQVAQMPFVKLRSAFEIKQGEAAAFNTIAEAWAKHENGLHVRAVSLGMDNYFSDVIKVTDELTTCTRIGQWQTK